MARQARSFSDSYDDGTAGLADIVANLMALFILLTVFVLLAQVTSVPAQAQQKSVAGGEIGTFLPRVIEPVERPGALIVVTGDGFAIVNISGLFDELMTTTAGSTFEITEGIYLGGPLAEAERLRPPSSDHAFSLGYSFEVSDVPQEVAIIDDDPNTILSILREQTPEGAPLDFFVFPDGVPLFSPVYQELTDTGECFRWQAWTRTVAAWNDKPNPIRVRPGSLLGQPGCPAA